MAKHLIVDGYNVLGAMGLPPSQVVGKGESHREAFIARLGFYAQSIHCPITVVFDAWQQSGKTRQIVHQTGVTVIYSSKGEQADQVIQQLIRQHGKESAIVSSDHEILNVARAHGAFMIRSQEFLSRITQSRHKGPPTRSKTGSASEKVEEAESTRPKEKKGNAKKLPKRLRQRNRTMRRF